MASTRKDRILKAVGLTREGYDTLAKHLPNINGPVRAKRDLKVEGKTIPEGTVGTFRAADSKGRHVIQWPAKFRDKPDRHEGLAVDESRHTTDDFDLPSKRGNFAFH